MSRTLYIGATHGTRITLESTALCVARPRTADQLFPLARVAYVVARDTAEWSPAALRACMERGITISFRAGDGRIVGTCVGRRPHAPDLARLAAGLARSAEMQRRYADWLGAEERGAQRYAFRKLEWRPPSTTSSRHLWRHLEKNLAPPMAAGLVAHLRGYLEAHISAELAQRVPYRHFRRLASGLDLLGDAERVLAWRLWPAAPRLVAHANRHPGKLMTQSARDRWLTNQYEAMKPNFDKQIREWMARLEDLLRRETSP